ncbi:MAG: hypothetical protein RL514_2948 [Verrucomicrobiota bacterium]
MEATWEAADPAWVPITEEGTPPELITGIITPEGIFKPGELWKHRRKLGGPR